MKKILGLLALTLAVSGVASADQDFLKTISVDTNVRYQFQDISGNDANGIGNEGFKQENRIRTRWLKTVSGTVHLSDEFDLDADFAVTHRNETIRKGHKREKENEFWAPSLTIYKGVKLGSLDTKFAFGWKQENNKVVKANEVKVDGARTIWNEFTLGPSFTTDVFGQKVNVNTGVVYFKLNGETEGEYFTGKFEKGKSEGWGLNLGLSTGGNLYEGSLGTISYGLGFNHFFRDASGKLASGEKAPSNVKLSYTQNIKYSTPTYAGFSGYVNFTNEWTKHTVGTRRVGKTGKTWGNEFNIIPGVDYKTKFETSVGTVTVNPYVSYSALQRVTEHNKNNKDNKNKTTEKNEVRLGLKLTLDVDR